MEDDEEIQSHPSGGSGSPPVSPRSNGRITVTVAAAPPSSSQGALTLALPIQQQQPRPTGNSGGGGGGREDCWSEGATSVLIDAWGERYLELSRGNLKQKHWKDVADVVSSREDYQKTPKTDIQCKNRIDTVKKKYKLEKAKIAAGGYPSKWPFYERLDQLIGPTAKISSVGAGAGPSMPISGSLRVPVGIPVGVRSAPQLRQTLPQQKQKMQLRKRPPVDSDEESEPEADSGDDFPPETYERKRPRVVQRELRNMGGGVIAGPPGVTRLSKDGGGRVGGSGEREKGGGGKEKENWGNSVRELTRAILKFGEAYEQAESSKLQQLVDMEKQRMKFTKELELQRMQFFMKTQLELSQLNQHRRVGGNSNHQHHSGNNNNANNNNNNNNNSDSSN